MRVYAALEKKVHVYAATALFQSSVNELPVVAQNKKALLKKSWEKEIITDPICMKKQYYDALHGCRRDER